MLEETAERLTAAARPGDLIGRLGGDEFALLIHRVDARQAAIAADRFESALADVIGASVGVALLPEHGTALDVLLAWADRRLYETKVRRRQSGVGVGATMFEMTTPERDFIS